MITRSLPVLTLATLLSLFVSQAAEPSPTTFPAPKLERAASGVVTLTSTTPDTVARYTLDGSAPNKNSGPYLAPIELPFGGVVKARLFSVDRKVGGEIAELKCEPVKTGTPPPATLVPVTQDRDWPIYDWATRHAAVTALVNKSKPELVFVGDSITQMFGGEPHDRSQLGQNIWAKYYAKRNAANLGFGYDFVENTLWRIRHGELDAAAAKVIVLLLGTNNIGKDSPENITAGIRVIIAEFRQRQPRAKILLLGILPRAPKPDAGRAKINEVNALLAKLDGQNGVTYLDVGPKLIEPDGSITREVMGDFLHPTEKGYARWAEAMELVLARLLGETKP
jgi:lysophospholipase L1-like esterase